jgi:hypothetical protein
MPTKNVPEQAVSFRTYSVLGVPLEVITEDVEILGLTEEALGCWGAPAGERGASVLRVIREVDDRQSGLPYHPVCDVTPTRVEITCPVAHAAADQERCEGVVRIKRLRSREDEEVVRSRIETLAIFLAFRYRPITLHAAAVARGGRCVLLTGSDGAGKSTLAYACLCGGMQLLAEDVVFAAEPGWPLTVYGNPWRLHLLRDAPRFFPELCDAPASRQLNGEEKIVVDVAARFPNAPITSAKAFSVLSVEGAGGKTSILEANREAVIRSLTQFRGNPPVHLGLMEQAAKALLQGPIGRLQVGSDPVAAVAVISDWLELPL